MRRGLSLTEILISMGLMTLGLLGVLSIFPVGSFYMVQAEIADNGSALAKSVMSDLVARGMLDPNHWRMLTVAPLLPGEVPSQVSSYQRPVGTARDQSATPWQLAQRAGSVYILDPMAVAVTSVPNQAGVNKLGASFPAEAAILPASTYSGCAAWQPWLGNADYWPIKRVTLLQADTGRRMDAPLAWSLFAGNSDLSFDQAGSDQPAIQLASYKAGSPMIRQSVGDYSCLVTAVPAPDAWHVSVVVFYKRGISANRVASTAEASANGAELQARERIVKAKIVSTGPNGGEVLIESATSQANPFQFLKAGQWVMLCGPKPIMATGSPDVAAFAANWYRVQAVDGEDDTRILSLRGPEWAWLPQGNANDLSNNLCVGLFPGAVAVHSKTIRLADGR